MSQILTNVPIPATIYKSISIWLYKNSFSKCGRNGDIVKNRGHSILLPFFYSITLHEYKIWDM